MVSETITNQDTRDIDANFGIKVPIIGLILNDSANIGVETQHVSTAQRMLEYPGDVRLNELPIFYHDPLMLDTGIEVFGYKLGENPGSAGTRGGTDRFGNPIPPSPIIELDACSTLEME